MGPDPQHVTTLPHSSQAFLTLPISDLLIIDMSIVEAILTAANSPVEVTNLCSGEVEGAVTRRPFPSILIFLDRSHTFYQVQ